MMATCAFLRATWARRAISRVDIPAFFNLTQSRTWRIDILSIGIGTSLAKPKERTLNRPEEVPSPRAISARNRERDDLGMVGDFFPETRAI
jgi:hypothetical protein